MPLTPTDRRRARRWPMDRRAWRIGVAGVAAALIVLGAGRVLERVRIGPTDATALDRIAAEVQQRFVSMARGVQDAANPAGVEPALVAQAGPDRETASRLFDLAEARVDRAAEGLDALTVFDEAGQPLAWAGRPSTLPAGRIQGPSALFVAPGPQGLRLVALEPIIDASAPRPRVGAIAAEQVLTRDAPVGRALAGGAPPGVFTFPSSLAPVSLRPLYEGAGDTLPPYGFLVTAPDGTPLLEAQVDPSALRQLRHRWRARVHGASLAIGALTLLLLAGLAREHQERARGAGPYLALAGTVVLVLVAARTLAALAVPADWIAEVDAGPWLAPLLRSAADTVVTPLLLLAVVLLAGDLVERCRLASRRRRRLPDSAAAWAAFWAVQIAAGTAVGAILLGHEHALAALLAHYDEPGLQFSLHPFDVERLAALCGALLLNAAALWLAVVALRAAATRWRVAREAIGLRLSMAAVYGVTAVAVLVVAGPLRPGAPVAALVPAVVAAILMTAWLRWAIPRYRRASQASRLTLAYVALALPSAALYPEIVALANAAIERTIAHDYAIEALNHRSELREQLRTSLEQLDRLAAASDQFGMDVPVPAGAPDAERAFLLWSQTALGRQRLTSSVELYRPDGTLVSRFALNLPAEFLATEQPVDTDCDWDVFGEALASTDDQVLLHAGRAICAPDGPGGTRRIGILLVHVVLDYGTLSFVAERDPTAVLLRPERAGDPAHGREVHFAVYGWGRTPVYPTTGTAWPISTGLLRRIYSANREPFWATLRRGDRAYRVLLSNDRAGIYAIGYPVLRVTDHAVALAELLTTSAIAFVGLLAAIGLLSRLAGRRPATGRALLREIRQSFYRKLFLLFVASSVVPVLALAVVTRAYAESQLREGLASSALRTAAVARRVVETVVSQRRGLGSLGAITDEMLVSVSRIIDQDVSIFAGPRLLATSQRDLFASGLLPTRTPAEAARALTLERQSSYIGDERVGVLQYTVAAVPVRDAEGGAIVTVPLTLRQQEIEREIDDLDRRVALAAVVFILLGAAIGYVTAERIADPVNRLTRASRRIARGDLSARIHVASADELQRLVEAFNQMAADLGRQRAELERTNRLAAWADMARQVAHDIKNPLTPIQLSSEHLRRVHRDEGMPLGPVLDDCVDTILSQVSLLRQIASEFASFASSPVARPAPTRVEEVIAEVLAPYETALPVGLTLEVQQDGALPVLSLDRGLLARALVNVIENALHAMRGGGTLTVRSAPTAEGGAVIEVRDTGIGMDAEALSRLFEPYFSTKATGTGLGLTIARRNVELNGGAIAVESEKGRGTVVRMTLPPARADAAAG